MAFKAAKRAFDHCFSGKMLSPEVWGKNGKDWVLVFLCRQGDKLSRCPPPYLKKSAEESLKNHRMNLFV